MDRETFENHIFPVRNKLYRFALRLLGDDDEAKDVVQDVLVKVWNGKDGQGIQNWEAWCMQIVKNLSLDHLRSRQRRKSYPLEAGAQVQHPGKNPYENTEMDEHMARIHEAMNALPEKQKQVIHLRDVEGYSYQEIGETLGLDMGQVKINLFRARNAVRLKLFKWDAYGVQ